MRSHILLLRDNLRAQLERAYRDVEKYESTEDPDGEVVYNEGKAQGKANALSNVIQKLNFILSENETEGGDKDGKETTDPMA